MGLALSEPPPRSSQRAGRRAVGGVETEHARCTVRTAHAQTSANGYGNAAARQRFSRLLTQLSPSRARVAILWPAYSPALYCTCWVSTQGLTCMPKHSHCTTNRIVNISPHLHLSLAAEKNCGKFNHKLNFKFHSTVFIYKSNYLQEASKKLCIETKLF